MTTSVKHASISRQIMEDISTGKFSPHDRIPSEIQLAKRFGVSRPTIARALRDLEMSNIVERRVGSGTYIKEQAERGVTSSVKKFGLIVPDFGRLEIFDIICGELASVARSYDFHLLWGHGKLMNAENGDPTKDMIALCEEFIEKDYSGVFFAPIEHVPDSDKANRYVADRLNQAGIPVVLLDRDYLSTPLRSDFDIVAVDHFRSGYLVADHLIKMGCHRLAFVTKPRSASTVHLRIAGAREALFAHRTEVPRNFVQIGDPGNTAFLQSLTAGRPFDAVICANDQTAAQLMQGLARLRIRVPEQLRIVGFDDVRYATLLSIPLTTVHQPCRDIATTAFRAMIDRLSDPNIPPRQINLTPYLVIRESCGNYLRSNKQTT